MNYRLKDHELQRKLDEISNGAFSAQLELEKDIISKRFNHSSHVIWFGRPFMSLTIQVGMLERVAEYDPHAWNRWPDVTPPANVPMRVKKVRNGEVETFCCRTWVPENDFDLQWRKDFGGAWWVIHSGKPDEIDDDTWEPGYTFLFRPWDEEDEE